MKNSNSNQDLHAIIIGNSGDEFVRHIIKLLGIYEIEHVLCGDIYRAFSWLLRNGRGKVLVVGRIEHLNREEGRFLQKVSDGRGLCCCFADKHLTRRQERILAVEEKGAFVISESKEVEGILKKLLVGKKSNVKASTFNRDEFLTTKAELDALLEV